MMSEVINHDDAVDSTFEIVNASGGTSLRQTPDVPFSSSAVESTTVTSSVLSAPTALPSFAQMPPAPASTASPVPAQHHQPPFSVPAVSSVATSVPPPPSSSNLSGASSTNPFSVRAVGGQSLNSVVHSSPHVPPASPLAPSPPAAFIPPPVPSNPVSSSYAMMTPPPVQHSGFDMPFEVSTTTWGQTGDPNNPLISGRRPSGAGAGMWNWINKNATGSDFISKMAEKFKTSVDSMITTLDPQMKDYMNPAGAVELYVASADVDIVSSIKTGFSKYFPNLIIRGVPPGFSPKIAQQPVGFEQGVAAAKEMIQAVQSSGLVVAGSLVLAFSSFLAQSWGENWLEFYCVALGDGASVDLHSFSQPVSVPNFAMDIIKHQTPADYPLASIGFAYSVDQVMSHSHGFTTSSWHLQFAGLTKPELINFACISLAYAYRATCFA